MDHVVTEREREGAGWAGISPEQSLLRGLVWKKTTENTSKHSSKCLCYFHLPLFQFLMENGPLWEGKLISQMPRGAEIKACLGDTWVDLHFCRACGGISWHLLSTGSREACDLWVKVLGSLSFQSLPPQVLDHPGGPCFPARQSSPLPSGGKNHLPQQVQAKETGQ